jgi:predicted small metal-binding protein
LIISREDIPESESFISCTSDYSLAIRTHSQIKDPIGVSSKNCKFLIFWVVPDDNLVERVAVSAHKFVDIFREDQIANLRSRINDMRLYTLEGVPKPNRAICGS